MWEQAGSRLFAFRDSSTWWIADWLVYGEHAFQDRYAEAIKRTALSYQTLRNYTWVARKFPLPRRRPALSFSHHLEAVALDQPEQDYWLRRAEELNWTRNKLRAEIRGSLQARQGEPALPAAEAATTAVSATAVSATAAAPRGRGAEAPEARRLHLELSAEDLARLERAADRDSEPLEAWAAAVLRQAAAQS